MSFPGTHSRYEAQLGVLAGIPVRVSAWYLAVVWVVTARTGSIQQATQVLFVLTASVLAHELGHAFAARHYRLRPAVLLHGLGGWCEHSPPRTRNQALVVVAAGPGVTVAIALLCYGAITLLPTETLQRLPAWLPWALSYGATLNGTLAVLNLLPVLPLDGGSIALNLLSRTKMRTPDRVLRWTGVVLGAVIAVLALVAYGSLFLTLLFGVLAYENYAALGHQRSLQMLNVQRDGSGVVRGHQHAVAPSNLTWRPTRGAAVIASVVGAFGLLLSLLNRSTERVVVDGAKLDLWSLSQGEGWRLLTWTLLGPPGNLAQITAALALILVCGSALERRVGLRTVLQLLAASVVTSTATGLLAMSSIDPGAAVHLQGALIPTAALLTGWSLLAGSWALPRPIGRLQAIPIAWAVGALCFFIGFRAVTEQATGWGLAWFASAATGVVFIGFSVPSVAVWRSFVDARRLANPPPIDLKAPLPFPTSQEPRRGNRPR